MQINNNNYSISELLQMIDRREIIVNKDYQRGTGLWPSGPSSYFIDTILQKYPFPKIYMHEYLTRPDMAMRKDIVDGQQRINTMQRFFHNEFRISGNSPFSGKYFNDLDEEIQAGFLQYTVSVDVIRNANAADILQMFRRMNAYTLPLNEAEKRHSQFQGTFKWFVNSITDSLNEFLVQYGVFKNREIVRMADAELVTECILTIERGIVSSSPTLLRSVYEKFEDSFPEMEEYREKIIASFNFISTNFDELRRTNMMKPYALHTLIVALVHARWGIPSITNDLNIPSLGTFTTDAAEARNGLLALAQAHEAKETDGPYAKYVWGSLGGTNRAGQRTARLAAILRVLGCNVPVQVDANLP